MRLYLDSSAIIYSIEGVPSFREWALRFIEQAEAAPDGLMITSCLSWMECRVKPLREGNKAALRRFDDFFSREKLLLMDVSTEVIERATELRARHGFRAPDAIHLATAQLLGADVFLTGDAALERCPDLNVVTLSH